MDWKSSVLCFVASATLFGTGTADAQCVMTADGSGVQCQTLYAGQTIDAGTVCTEVIGTDLVVTWSATGSWELTETHLWVGRDLANLPQTRKGNPKVGNFPYASGDITGATTYSQVISLDSLGFTCPDDDTDFFVAAHAALRSPDGSGGYQTETGWGDGSRFVEKGNWGTFFTLVLTCNCGPSDPGGGTGSCETAYAYGVDSATCFLDIDEDGDGSGDFNRWGWTNSLLPGETATWPIYAGAGQCDLTKGTLVGTLTATYNGDGTVRVEYTMDAGFTMDESHVYVGGEILPRDNTPSMDYTVAPGQYGNIHDLVDATSDVYTVGPFTGPVYVVAHAAVCGTGGGSDPTDPGNGGGQPCGVPFVDLQAVEDLLADAVGPDGEMILRVTYPYSGSPSYFGSVLSDNGDGSGDLVGSYEGYCVDTNRTIQQNKDYCVRVVSSYADEAQIPDDETNSNTTAGNANAGFVEMPENLDAVNWLINQGFVGQDISVALPGSGCSGIISSGDMQKAIWGLVEDDQSNSGIYNADSCRWNALIAAALANGEGFVPGCNENLAVLLRPVVCGHMNDPLQAQITIAQITLVDIPQVCDVVPCGPCVATSDGTGTDCQTLYAGQTIPAGTVCTTIVGTDLVITYMTTGGWEMEETHLWVGDDIANMPQTRSGNPKVGNFPYASGDITGATTYSVAIPLDNLPFACPGPDMDFYVAAHTAVRRSDGMGGYQTETAWGDGDRFVEQGNWGTFSNFTLTCADCSTPDEDPTGNCETAYAYGMSDATCFLDLTVDTFNRWGWTNMLSEESSVVWPIYAGAGQCDTTKGALVGGLTVTYSGGTVEVTYDMDPGFTMAELHLYVGNEVLPRDVNSDYTVAPGQYPFILEDLDDSTYVVPPLTGLSGDVYVVAHAVVCGPSL